MSDEEEPEPGAEPPEAEAEAANPLDVPTEPEIAPPRWPPDEDPFVELGLYDDLI
jgi:hypothetical protein